MEITKFTEKLQEALSVAQAKAIRNGHQQVDLEHLMLALLEQERGLATSILNKADIDATAIQRKLEQELNKLPKVSGAGGAPDQVYITGRLRQVLTKAQDEARNLGDEYVSIEHVLLAATEDSGATGRIFKQYGLTRE